MFWASFYSVPTRSDLNSDLYSGQKLVIIEGHKTGIVGSVVVSSKAAFFRLYLFHTFSAYLFTLGIIIFVKGIVLRVCAIELCSV